MIRTKRIFLSLALLLMVLGGLFATTSRAPYNALAGASISGNPATSDARVLISENGSSKVSRIVYFNTGAKTNPGANTPVASGPICGSAVSGTYHYAEVRLVGTMSGTNPTLTVKLQTSYDNKATWVDVKTFTAYNATTVPAVQTKVAVDQPEYPFFNGTTTVITPAAVFGDCFRITYVYGGTSAGASFSVIGIDK